MQLFSNAEYTARIHDIKTKMLETGIDVLIDPDPADIFYITGYRGMSYYTQQCVVVVQDEEKPFVFTRAMDASAVVLQSWLDANNVISWPDELANSNDQNPYDFLGKVLKYRSWNRLVIGIEEDAGMYSPRDDKALRNALSGSTIRDCTSLVRSVRRVKSAAELQYMKEAAAITERAMRAGTEGMLRRERECDIIANVYKACVGSEHGIGGDYPANPPMMPSGNNIANPHLTWTDDTLPQRGSATLELSGARHRYHAPMARTVYLGGDHPPQKLLDTSKFAIDGLNETLTRSRVGMTAGEVFSIWDEYNQKFDLQKTSRLGYGIGCAFPPSWLERTTSIRAGDNTVISENMTFHIIIGIWRADVTFEVSEAVVMTESGFEKLCQFEQGLIIAA